MSATLIRILLFWVLTTVAMVLHFDFHIGDLFYGIDIVQPGANG